MVGAIASDFSVWLLLKIDFNDLNHKYVKNRQRSPGKACKKQTCHEADNDAYDPDRIGRKVQFADLGDQKHWQSRYLVMTTIMMVMKVKAMINMVIVLLC